MWLWLKYTALWHVAVACRWYLMPDYGIRGKEHTTHVTLTVVPTHRRRLSSLLVYRFSLTLKLSGEMLAWLSVWGEVHICIWPSWCHCHSPSLASVNPDGFTFLVPAHPGSPGHSSGGRKMVVVVVIVVISFQDFQPMWSWSTSVTDRQTDRQHAIARPCFALQ